MSKKTIVLKGFFFEIKFSECRVKKSLGTRYGPMSDRYQVDEYSWSGQASIKDRETGKLFKFLIKSEKQENNINHDFLEYIFGTDNDNALEKTVCEKAVIDFYAKSMLKGLKKSKEDKKADCIIPEIYLPRMSAETLKKYDPLKDE